MDHREGNRMLPSTQTRREFAVVAVVGVVGTAFAAVGPLPPGDRALFGMAVWAVLFGGVVLRRWRQSAADEGRLRMLRGRLRREEEKEQQAAEALRWREAFYRTILDDIPEMIVRWRPDGIITYVNEAYCRYIGQSREDVLTRQRLPLFDGSKLVNGLTPEEPVSVVEYQVNRPDGRRCWQRWAERALFDDDGNVQEVQSIGDDVTERKQEEERIARLLEQNRALARRSLEIQELERARLARELHDELGQCLTAIRADAELIRGRTVGRDGVIHESAQAIDQVAEQVYGVVRRMMRRLRPASLDELGLLEALQETVQEWAERHPQVRCRLDADGELSGMPKAVGTTAYRIVQEALTNIAKHAQAGSVTIRLKREQAAAGQTELWVEVTDDGRGMDPEQTAGGFGMLGMRERAQAVGGEVDVEPGEDQGTTVRARLPLDVNAEEAP